MEIQPTFHIVTDGACHGNPGRGGWAAIVKTRTQEHILMGCANRTTNNRMEMMAAVMALDALPHPAHVLIETDSQYLRNGITKWVHTWQKNNWRTADKKPVKNKDLWLALLSAANPHQIQWKWVKGHAGHKLNEKADQLASQALRQRTKKHKLNLQPTNLGLGGVKPRPPKIIITNPNPHRLSDMK